MIPSGALWNPREVVPRGKFKHYIRRSFGSSVTQNEMGASCGTKHTVTLGEGGWLPGRDITEGDFHSEKTFDSSSGYQPGLHGGRAFEIPMQGCTPEQLNQNFWRWDPGHSDS